MENRKKKKQRTRATNLKKTVTSMVGINPTTLIITLNVNDSYESIKSDTVRVNQ